MELEEKEKAEKKKRGPKPSLVRVCLTLKIQMKENDINDNMYGKRL